MYRNILILVTIINEITGDCLYPEWKKTCQKYCMDNQLYEIQLNQCYSINPAQLRCRCSGQDLTEKIRDMMENKNPKSTSTITSSTIPSNEHIDETCIPSNSCTTGRIICHGVNAYCACENGVWINTTCPKGNLCKTKDMKSSCEKVSIIDENFSFSSVSNSADSNKIQQYFQFFIQYLLILKIKIF